MSSLLLGIMNSGFFQYIQLAKKLKVKRNVKIMNSYWNVKYNPESQFFSHYPLPYLHHLSLTRENLGSQQHQYSYSFVQSYKTLNNFVVTVSIIKLLRKVQEFLQLFLFLEYMPLGMQSWNNMFMNYLYSFNFFPFVLLGY